MNCNVCQAEFSEEEGGVEGYFGILPVSFCPTCYSCMYDMITSEENYEIPTSTE